MAEHFCVMKRCLTSSPDVTADMQMKLLELQNNFIKQTADSQLFHEPFPMSNNR
jgi:hypothetical protein